jgi:hypothetical protein
MTSRSRRYFFYKKVNKMIIRELSKNIQEEIDRQILEEILIEAKAQGIETNLTPEGKLLLNKDI